MTRSVMTVSMGARWSTVKACSPSAAVVTSYPSRFSMAASTRRMLGSSSTMRRFATQGC